MTRRLPRSPKACSTFVGYVGAIDQPAGALSHVDKRLVEIARALAIRPAVLALSMSRLPELDATDTAAVDRIARASSPPSGSPLSWSSTTWSWSWAFSATSSCSTPAP